MAAAAGNVGATPAPPAADARLKALYSVMQSIENKLGGGEGVEGLYGSIKKSGMDKVVECMAAKCGLDSRSVMVDIGAGLGRPLLHALLEPGIAGARGIEIDRIKCDKAAAFCKQAVAELRRRGIAGAEELVPPPVECSAIEKVRSLDPCTHAYSFWEGVPWEGKAAFGALFAACRTLRSVAVVQRAIRTCPLEYMDELGFGELVLVGSFSVSMSGSGRSFTAYVFNKVSLPLALPHQTALEQAAAHSVETPAQAGEGAAVAAVSTGAVAAAAELDGETADSRLAAAAAVMSGPNTMGRGRRQRQPSTRQQQAEEELEEEAEEAPRLSAREQRADRRNSAAREAARAADVQLAAQAALTEHQAAAPPVPVQAQQPIAVSPADLPAKNTRSRSISSPDAGKPSAKLSSPQKGGVQKRASPVKAATRTSPRTEHSAASASRKLALFPTPTSKAAATEKVVAAPGSAGLLHRASRVVKSSLAEGISKLRPTRAGAAARRGLQS
ncbi:hypothetical protein ACK3TF_003578 [Chlorella vulgaris]